MTTYQSRELFGGAIAALLPPTLVDASQLRQVPDTQEVFLYPDSDVSIIVEILERVEPSDFSEAAKFHFDSLAHDNSAQSSAVREIAIIPNDRGDQTPSPVVLYGTQLVQKFNRADVDDVRILLALYRVEHKGVDVVMTMNIPMRASDNGAVGEEGFTTAKADFDTAVRSLQIADFGLFEG
ncbi:Mog1p/PsbP-like protein [Stereum hirsutum FP-91666 SS1]|uniref:Mog1p/PsbP-like protein n=1 Tax=Stereum hirsutum (strain FP-91666) TaxID=721885 RepID=UPI000440EC9C|nr:Mog1p/PsbP-like protein [Stereum hirsutum FP-91666 SS1]EIM90400.1 Mog1p/PsbP-like protein [Stereum hirsutum FP-91666 SS1]